MKKLTKLKDGHYIGMAAIKIDMIPSAENLDSDIKVALKKNLALYAEVVNMLAHGSNLPDTVLEMLCITKKVSNQSYEAQPNLFLVIRKFGSQPSLLDAKIQAFCDSCSASLQSSSYTVQSAGDSWDDLQVALSSIKEESVLSLEKQVRVGTLPGQSGFMSYTDPYRLLEANNFERVY